MPEIPNNIVDSDVPNVLSTYKSHPTEADNAAPKGLIIEPEKKNIESHEEIIQIPKYDTLFEKAIYIFLVTSRQGIRVIELIINGSIIMTKVGVWFVAICGGLFVALLATNTMNQATEIINTNILAKWGKSIDVLPNVSGATKIIDQKVEITPQKGLQSNILNAPPIETPEIVIQRRAALIEARKAARLDQEKLANVEKSLIQ